jgi:hypothetical protein
MAAPKKRTPVPKTRTPVAAQEAPRSAAHFGLNLLGLLGGVLTILGMIHWSVHLDKLLAPLPWHLDGLLTNSFLIAFCACAVVALIIGAGELFWRRSYLNPATGLAGKPLRAADWGRVGIRLLGFAGTLAIIAFVYWLFPEYSLDRGGFYNPFWALVVVLAGPVLVLAPFYFAWTDARLADPHDSYWQLGMFILGRGAAADRSALPQHFMGWTVKCFFLPLMIRYLVNDVDSLGRLLGAVNTGDGMSVYHFLFEFSYTVDLLFCVVGYAVTLRIFDSHIRSTEPTAFGWVIALLCYMPFYSIIGSTYLAYENDAIFWDGALAGWPALEGIWGAIIIGLLFIYSLSTVSFGLRFSNLTYRGIITGGTYRFCKHPAYLSKNLSWWMITMPWLVHEHWYVGLRNCCLLAILSTVYYLRARTEENHLSKDPDYVAYALWMEEHGPLRFLGRMFPILRYKPPQNAAVASAPVAPQPVKGAALARSR